MPLPLTPLPLTPATIGGTIVPPRAASPTLTADPVDTELTAAVYRRCDCTRATIIDKNRSAMQGCRLCYSTRWLKRCVTCCASGFKFVAGVHAASQPRSVRCMDCSGNGWRPCPMAEVKEAEKYVKAQEKMGLSSEAVPANPNPSSNPSSNPGSGKRR